MLKKIHHTIWQFCLAGSLLFPTQTILAQSTDSIPKEVALTTAVSVIDSKSLTQSPFTLSGNALAGKAAGLTVLQIAGNEPGVASAGFFIRGIGTENAMRSPYILVDDVERSFNRLDVHEIESITILKDGASNTQYGQRGANGSILVTTKRGFAGKTEIDFISQIGTQQPTRLPQYLNAREYTTFYNKALQNDGLLIPNDDKYNPSMYDGQNPLQYPNVDWYNEFLSSNAFQQQHKLMFRGGTENIRFFVLMGYLNQQGLYKHTNLNKSYNTNIVYDRFNVRTNLDANVNKSLVVSLDLAGQMENRNTPNVSSGDIFSTLSSLPSNAMPIQYADTMLAGNSRFRNNPLGMISRTGYRKDRNIALQVKVKAVQDLNILTPGLSAEVAFGYDGSTAYGLYKSENYAVFESQAGGAFSKYGENVPLSLNMNTTNTDYYYLMTFWGGFNYKRNFAQHGLHANLRYYQAQSFVRGDNPPYGKQGVNGGFGYGFDQRYFVDLAFSYDGSDEFAKGHRFGFFPAISVGWLISNEAFLKGHPLITSLNLRASYGEAGNCKTSGLDRYAYQSHWYGFDGSYGGYIFGSGFAWSDGSWEGRMPNPNLTWETTRNTNVGVDVSLGKAFSLHLDGFIHQRDNIILALENTTSSIIGAPKPYANAGAVTNQGFETSLAYTKKIDQVNVFLQGNVSFARNTIRKTDEIDGLPNHLKRSGYSVTQLFGMQSIGFYQNQDDIDNSPVNTLYKVRPGDIKYEDVNKDGFISELDEKAIGSPQLPEWTFGFNAGLEYAGFDLSAVLSAFEGRSVFLNNNAVWILQGNENATNLANGAWEAGVREENASYPRLTTEVNRNNYRSSSFWVKNGAFLRLNHLEIGYSFSKKWMNQLKINGLRVYANGQNLLSFDALKAYHLDPEVTDAGITGYPITRTMNIGLNIKF
ncbi:SusC/RagA family TonB-linked outer membrane protein [Bacteroidia bacterium]|nr:SusC/RagA family TonB-linked outer membrane protein [Bacteroidia bacterium]